MDNYVPFTVFIRSSPVRLTVSYDPVALVVSQVHGFYLCLYFSGAIAMPDVWIGYAGTLIVQAS